MRITGGALKGRKIHAPCKSKTAPIIRPTSDKVREALFQILSQRMPATWGSIKVLDLFAGTGALGIEALSRGAAEVIFVDKDKKALELVKKNLDTFKVSSRTRTICAEIDRKAKSLKKLLKENRFDLVLADPPYSQDMGRAALELVAETSALMQDGWMVVEEFIKTELPQELKISEKKILRLFDKRNYGQTNIWFYKMEERT